MNNYHFELGSTKQKVVRSIPLTGARGREDTEVEQRNYLICDSLSDCIVWETLVCCLSLVVLLNLEAFIEINSGLSFGLLTRLPRQLSHLNLIAFLFDYFNM